MEYNLRQSDADWIADTTDKRRRCRTDLPYVLQRYFQDASEQGQSSQTHQMIACDEEASSRLGAKQSAKGKEQMLQRNRRPQASFLSRKGASKGQQGAPPTGSKGNEVNSPLTSMRWQQRLFAEQEEAWAPQIADAQESNQVSPSKSEEVGRAVQNGKISQQNVALQQSTIAAAQQKEWARTKSAAPLQDLELPIEEAKARVAGGQPILPADQNFQEYNVRIEDGKLRLCHNPFFRAPSTVVPWSELVDAKGQVDQQKFDRFVVQQTGSKQEDQGSIDRRWEAAERLHSHVLQLGSDLSESQQSEHSPSSSVERLGAADQPISSLHSDSKQEPGIEQADKPSLTCRFDEGKQQKAARGSTADHKLGRELFASLADASGKAKPATRASAMLASPGVKGARSRRLAGGSDSGKVATLQLRDRYKLMRSVCDPVMTELMMRELDTMQQVLSEVSQEIETEAKRAEEMRQAVQEHQNLEQQVARAANRADQRPAIHVHLRGNLMGRQQEDERAQHAAEAGERAESQGEMGKAGTSTSEADQGMQEGVGQAGVGYRGQNKGKQVVHEGEEAPIDRKAVFTAGNDNGGGESSSLQAQHPELPKDLSSTKAQSSTTQDKAPIFQPGDTPNTQPAEPDTNGHKREYTSTAAPLRRSFLGLRSASNRQPKPDPGESSRAANVRMEPQTNAPLESQRQPSPPRNGGLAASRLTNLQPKGEKYDSDGTFEGKSAKGNSASGVSAHGSAAQLTKASSEVAVSGDRHGLAIPPPAATLDTKPSPEGSEEDGEQDVGVGAALPAAGGQPAPEPGEAPEGAEGAAQPVGNNDADAPNANQNVEVLLDVDLMDLLGLRGSILSCILGVIMVSIILSVALVMVVLVPISMYHMFAQQECPNREPNLQCTARSFHAGVWPFMQSVACRSAQMMEQWLIPSSLFRQECNMGWPTMWLIKALKPGTCPNYKFVDSVRIRDIFFRQSTRRRRQGRPLVEVLSHLFKITGGSLSSQTQPMFTFNLLKGFQLASQPSRYAAFWGVFRSEMGSVYAASNHILHNNLASKVLRKVSMRHSGWLQRKLAALEDHMLLPDIFVFPGAFSVGLLVRSYFFVPVMVAGYIVLQVVWMYAHTWLHFYRVYCLITRLQHERLGKLTSYRKLLEQVQKECVVAEDEAKHSMLKVEERVDRHMWLTRRRAAKLASKDLGVLLYGWLKGVATSAFNWYLQVKVMVMVSVVVFWLPMLFGFWIDICAQPLSGITMADRMHYLRATPFIACLVYFLIGFALTLNAVHIISTMRHVLRREALPFLRDPNRDDFNPLEEIRNRSLLEHAQWTFTQVILHQFLGYVFVYLPLLTALRAYPTWLPFRLHIGSNFSFTQLPLDLLMMQLLIPQLVTNLQFERLSVGATLLWLKCVGWLLDLQEYLLPQESLPARLLRKYGQQAPAPEADVGEGEVAVGDQGGEGRTEEAGAGEEAGEGEMEGGRSLAPQQLSGSRASVEQPKAEGGRAVGGSQSVLQRQAALFWERAERTSSLPKEQIMRVLRVVKQQCEQLEESDSYRESLKLACMNVPEEYGPPASTRRLIVELGNAVIRAGVVEPASQITHPTEDQPYKLVAFIVGDQAQSTGHPPTHATPPPQPAASSHQESGLVAQAGDIVLALDDDEEEEGSAGVDEALEPQSVEQRLAARIAEVEQAPTFYMRLVLLVGLWAGSTIVVIAACLVLPIASGRALLHSLGVSLANDLQAASIGFATIVAAYLVSTKVHENMAGHAGWAWLRITLGQAARLLQKGLEVCTVTVMLCVVAATQLGVWMDWIHIPLRHADAIHTWSFYPITHCLSGLMVFKLMHMLVVNLPQGNPRLQRLRNILEPLGHFGFRNMNFAATMLHVVLPLCCCLQLALTLPIFALLGLLRYGGMPPELALQIWQHVYLLEAMLIVFVLVRSKLEAAVQRIQEAVRDDWYVAIQVQC